jgi:hypothetical protein
MRVGIYFLKSVRGALQVTRTDKAVGHGSRQTTSARTAVEHRPGLSKNRLDGLFGGCCVERTRESWSTSCGTLSSRGI